MVFDLVYVLTITVLKSLNYMMQINRSDYPPISLHNNIEDNPLKKQLF